MKYKTIGVELSHGFEFQYKAHYDVVVVSHDNVS